MHLGIRGKLNISILASVFIVLALLVGFFSINIRKQSKEDAFKLHDNISKEISKDVTALFNIDLGFTRSLATTYESFQGLSREELKSNYRKLLNLGIQKNPNYLAYWISLELSEIDPEYTSEYGRVTWLYDRLTGDFTFREEYRDLDPNDLSPQYQKIKLFQKESLINPYWYKPSYDGATVDSLLEATVGVPVFLGKKIVGLAGIDFSLEELQNQGMLTDKDQNHQAIIIAHDGIVVTHPNQAKIGQNILVTKSFGETVNVLDSIQKGISFHYSLVDQNDQKRYYTFSPIQIGNSVTPWSVCVAVPYTDVLKKANAVFFRSLLIGLSGLILLGLVVFILSTTLIKPIEATTKTLTLLSKGKTDAVERLKISSQDEIGLMTKAMNELNDKFIAITQFAREIGSGNFGVQYPYSSEEDILGGALNQMKRNLIKLDQDTRFQDWLKSGLNGLNEQIRGDKELAELSKSMVSYLAKYISCPVGALYHADAKSKRLRLAAGYAFNKRKSLNTEIQFGEGLVGQCALEKEMIILSQVPDDYFPIASATGSSNPKSIIVYPCIFNHTILAVVELGSFDEFNTHQLEFLKSASQSIAIGLNSAQAKDQTQQLLAKTLEQKEELQAQEEELREANKELEKHTEILKQSEASLQAQQEELRVTNQELERNSQMLEEQSESIRLANTELEKSQKEIEKKAKELAQASKYKSEFLANMSHELRTPLNSMLILSQSLADNAENNLATDEVEAAQIIYNSGRDLLNLINEVLDLSKIEAGKMDINIDRIDLINLSQNMTSLFKANITGKGLEFKIHHEDELPQAIFSDQLRVEQILKNLLSNAIKFTKNGSIELCFEKPGQHINFIRKDLRHNSSIAICVKDTGIGISAEKQRMIFEAFQQEDGSTSRKYGGTGLGLSISKELAGLLKGELHLESQQGKGSSFILILPLNHQKPENQEPEQEQEQEQGHTIEQSSSLDNPLPAQPENNVTAANILVQDPSIKNLSQTFELFIADDREILGEDADIILVIEDDQKFAKILLDQCHKAGFQCLVSGNGENGLQMAKHFLPSAIILDIKLPGMDGWKVLELLKKDPKTRHIPVHMMSAMEETIDAFHKGAIGYLTKPVSINDLQGAFDKIGEYINPNVKHLLIVEDNPQMRQTIRKVVKGKDIKITEIGNGSECLAELTQKSYDCIILDLGLPDMDGFELLKQIRNIDGLQVPPIIVYTGKELTKDQDIELKKYTKSIIIKGVKSEERLLDETALFLHRVVEDLSEQQQQIIKKLYDKENRFENKTLLIVDDDMRNVFALTRIFEEKGMTVIKAENGKKAIEALQAHLEIDIVLMDIMMPEMDGYEAMREIRKLDQFKELPIVALTAKAMKEDKQKCIEAGASDYITKPVDVGKLLSLVRVWINN